MNDIDLIGISNLMNHQFTFQESLNLLEDDENKEVFLMIKNELELGKSVDEFLVHYCNDNYAELLEGFLKILSLQKSLQLAIEIEKNRESLINKLRKKLIYPFFLMIGTLIGVILFNELCFPSLLSILKDFKIDMQDYLILQKIIRIFYQIMLIGFLVILINLMFFKSKSKQVKIYNFIYQKKSNCLLVKYVSILFSRYLKLGTQMNLSTKSMMQIMANLNQPIISSIAIQLDNDLNHGINFIETIQSQPLDNKLKKFMTMGYYSGSIEKLLDNYLIACNHEITHTLKRTVQKTQAFCYSFVGLMLIVVYNILMIPLSVINTIQ